MLKHWMEVDGVLVEAPDFLTWARWFETADRRVALDDVDGTRVSTVFLGLDHNYFGHGPPLLYETAIDEEHGWDPVARASTREQALHCHALALAEVRRRRRHLRLVP